MAGAYQPAVLLLASGSHEIVVWVFGSAEYDLRERDQHG
jgi:hypothetical protein